MKLASAWTGKSDAPPVVHVPKDVKWGMDTGNKYHYITHWCQAMTSRGRVFTGKQSDITCAKCLGMHILANGLRVEDWPDIVPAKVEAFE